MGTWLPILMLPEITDIAEDKKGRIWISSFDNSLCRTTEKLNLSNSLVEV